MGMIGRGIAVVALGAWVLVGCGKKEEAPPTPSAPGAVPSAPSGPAASGGQPAGGSAAAGAAGNVTAAKVRNALMTSKQVHVQAPAVEVEGTTVHLMGTVASAKEKALAVKTAQQAAGPKYKVMDMLMVGKGGK